jgi:hypothetical protein
MSSLWHETAPRQWTARTIPASGPLGGAELGVGGIAVMNLPRQGAVLFVEAGVWARVNGDPVPGGMRLLQHTDELLIEGARLVFSQQSAPIVVPFVPVEGQRLPTCPICRGPIRAGMEAVQCPGCGRWCHQQGAKTCWTYATTCRFCQHPTSFDAGDTWRPDQEDTIGR